MLSLLKNIFIRDSQFTSDSEKYSLDAIQDFVEENINTIMSSSIDDLGMAKEQIDNARKRKALFKKQLNLCGLGDLASKTYIKGWILDLITQKYGLDDENINYAINFDFPSNYDKFSIILYKYTQRHKFDAMKNLIKDYKLDKRRRVNGVRKFIVTKDDIDKIYSKEILFKEVLSFGDKLEIIVQRIYERTHGLSVIDELRDQKIDGLSLGLNGIPIDFISKINDMNMKNGTLTKYPISYDSVWLYFSGKEIHMECLSFGSQRELERICKKLYKFNNHKQFSKSDGFIFNNMADFSRIAVFRPPFCETWAAFIRKFDVDGQLDDLISGKNSECVSKLIEFIVKGNQRTCFSGQQGTGKTTMLVAGIKKFDGDVPIRIWESFFETFLRFKLPNHNIMTLREIPEINGERALDSYKKSNGRVSVISEAAEDIVISYIIKNSLTASETILWTHHAETADALVQSHRNACINIGSFRDENLAEDQVLSILKFNIHLKKNADGERYIERITEFIRLDDRKYSSSATEQAFYSNATKFFEKRTNAKRYEAINLIEYDLENKEYVIKNKMSQSKIQSIYENLVDEDKEDFKRFIQEFNLAAEVIKL